MLTQDTAWRRFVLLEYRFALLECLLFYMALGVLRIAHGMEAILYIRIYVNQLYRPCALGVTMESCDVGHSVYACRAKNCAINIVECPS